MTIYTYQIDQPSTNAPENKRLGYRMPRGVLLPPYLATNQVYADFMTAIDAVFETMVDIPTEVLNSLRNMWVQNQDMEKDYIQPAEMIPFESWSQPERSILVNQVNALGMSLQTSGALTNDMYQTVSRWLGQYWFGKGTQAFVQFMNYCMSVDLHIVKLWTQDYRNFLPEGDSGIGTPIWNGGTWYPTTTVNLTADASILDTLSSNDIITFFYDIANYNLVLNALMLTYNMNIVSGSPGDNKATIVAVALLTNIKYYIPMA